MTHRVRRLSNFDAVIRAFGGTAATARFTRRTMPAVCEWRRNGKFPSRLYFLMMDDLRERGYHAPRSLWTFEGLEEDVAA